MSHPSAPPHSHQQQHEVTSNRQTDRHSPAPVVQAPSLSPPQTPVSVCTPAGSPSAAPVFELPGSGTPTPPPKPLTPVHHKDTEVKVKLEIPELDDNRNCETAVNGSIEGRRLSKQSKLKPDPLSISNDVSVNHSVTSPFMHRGILPSLNTPMFLTSPMFGQRTPLIPGIHFWGPGTLSPVATLSPRFGSGLHAPPAFQFPAFSVSPATLASFSSFPDSVFTSSSASGSAANGDKKLSWCSTYLDHDLTRFIFCNCFIVVFFAWAWSHCQISMSRQFLNNQFRESILWHDNHHGSGCKYTKDCMFGS